MKIRSLIALSCLVLLGDQAMAHVECPKSVRFSKETEKWNGWEVDFNPSYSSKVYDKTFDFEDATYWNKTKGDELRCFYQDSEHPAQPTVTLYKKREVGCHFKKDPAFVKITRHAWGEGCELKTDWGTCELDCNGG